MAVVNRTIGRARSETGTEEKASKRLGLKPVLLLALGAIIAIGLLEIVQTSQATTVSFRIRGLEESKLELETQVRQLEAEVASLSALARIEREAQRLGLELPEGRESVGVNVAWPAADDELLPTRFAPSRPTEAIAEGDSSSWWRDLLKSLPF